MQKITLVAAATAISLLTACGGGGSDNTISGTTSPPTASTTAEGYWTGTTSTGAAVNLAILENGETWGVYSRSGVLLGAVNGTATSTNGTVTGSGIDFSSAGITPGGFSGSYVAKTSLTLKLSDNSTVNATYSTAYDQPASLTAIAGTYRGYVSTKSASGYDSVTVATDGTVRSGSASTCLTTGQVTPRASGKNVFNVTLSFVGPSCLLGNGGTTTGVAYYKAPTKQLITLTLNGGKTDGLVFLGSK